MTTTTLPANRLDVADLIHEHGVPHVAERMGVSERSVQRWVHNGVPVYLADKLAVKVAGDHPEFVWGAAWRNLEGGDRK